MKKGDIVTIAKIIDYSDPSDPGYETKYLGRQGVVSFIGNQPKTDMVIVEFIGPPKESNAFWPEELAIN